MSKHKKDLDYKYIFSFIVRFSIIVFLIFLISGLITTIFLNREIGPTYLESISTLNKIHTILPIIILITALLQAFTLSAITLIIALIWSHSVAGPLVRFRERLRGITQGKLLKEAVIFRDTDQLHNLAHYFSDMIITHEENNVQSLALLVKAQKIIDECKDFKNRDTDSSHEFNIKLKELEKIYLHIRDIYNKR